MKSSQFIRAKLVSRTNADCSSSEVRNNRYHYYLRFDDESIGWDWLDTQISKAQADTDTDLELYKIRPSGVQSFEVEVREVERRQGIDSSQNELTDFSKD